MQQPDQIVDDGGQGLAGRLGVAMGDLDGDVLVGAQQHLRVVLAIIDHGIVQAPEAGTGIERHIGEVEVPHEIDDDVGIPPDLGWFDFLAASFLRLGHPVSPLSFRKIG